jgi:hypothetical protein
LAERFVPLAILDGGTVRARLDATMRELPPCPLERQPRPESGDPDQVFSGVQRRILDQLQVGRDRQALEKPAVPAREPASGR